MYKIKDHFLMNEDGSPTEFIESPNHGKQIRAFEYLVMHYTAASSVDSVVRWFQNPNAYVSAHLVIGRDGRIVQMVPFNLVAWHAGYSRWENRTGLNYYSIGIELDNAGWLTRKGNKWTAYFGETYKNSDVLEAVHKNEYSLRGWHTFTPIQIETAIKVSNTIIRHYNMLDVVGHEDVSTEGKVDPGPAFPMNSFRARVMGRAGNTPAVYETTAKVPVRDGAGTSFSEIPGSPVPANTKVLILNLQGQWAKVEVMDEINGVPDMEGWINFRFIQRQGMTPHFPDGPN